MNKDHSIKNTFQQDKAPSPREGGSAADGRGNDYYEKMDKDHSIKNTFRPSDTFLKEGTYTKNV